MVPRCYRLEGHRAMIRRIFVAVALFLVQMVSAVDLPSRAQGFWPHDWVYIEEEVLTPQNGIWVTPFQLMGQNAVRIDANSTVYFGVPSQLWNNGPNPAAVGVPFVSAFGIGIENAGQFKVSIDRDGPNNEQVIQISGVRIAGMPSGTSLDFQIVASSSYSKSIESEIRFNWRLNKPKNFAKGQFGGVSSLAEAFLWNQSQRHVLHRFQEVLPVIGDREDTPVLGDDKAFVFNELGQQLGNLPISSFNGSFYIPGRSENTQWGLVSETSNKALKIIPDQSNSGYDGKLHNGTGMGLSTSREFPLWIWAPERVIDPSFDQVGGYSVKYRQENPEDCWRVWMFEDKGSYAHHLGIPCLEDQKFKHDPSSDANYKWIHIPIGTLGDRLNNFNSGNPTGYPVDAILRFVKIMGSVSDRPCSNPKGCNGSPIDILGSVLIDSIVVQRMQPQSYTIVQRLPDVNLKVQLIGNSSMGVAAVARPLSSGKTYSESSSNGLIQILVPSGHYEISLSGSGVMVSPSTLSWKPGDGVLYAYVTESEGQWTTDNKNQTLEEGVVSRFVLSDWINASQLENPAIHVEDMFQSGLPWKFDPITRVLELGDPNSDATGSTRLRLRSSIRGALPQFKEIEFTITPVNDAPVILASRFSTPAGSPLVVRLDESVNGKPRWVQDPDDGILNLEWSAEWSGTAPTGAVLTVQDRTLRVVPPIGVSGDMHIELSVQDPSGARSSRQVTITVTPSAWEISGLQARQLETGDLEWTFSSRFSKEPVVLQTQQIQLIASSSRVAFPATLEVLQQPGVTGGLSTEGRYRLTISPLAVGSGKTLASWVGDGTRLEFDLPFAADGRKLTVRSTVDPVDLKGTFATVIATPIYESSDPSRRHPKLRVSWQWDGPEPQSVTLGLVRAGTQDIQTFQVTKGATEFVIPGVLDGEKYWVSVISKDSKSNIGGGTALVTLPWGTYPFTLKLNDHQLPQVTGSIRLMSSLSSVMQRVPLSNGVDGVHSLPELTPGTWFVEIEDPRWMGTGVSLQLNVKRESGEASWTLVPSGFLVDGKARLEQGLDQDGLTLVIPTRENLVAGERPSKISLFVRNDLDEESAFELPVRADQINLDGATWLVQWSRADLPTTLISNAVWESSAKWLNRIKVETVLPADANTIFRSGTAKSADVEYHDRLLSFRAPVLADPETGHPAIISRTIYPDGKAVWQGEIVPSHGARWQTELCRFNTDASLDCSNHEAVPVRERLAFRTDLRAAYHVGSLPSLIEDPMAVGVVFSPEGVDAAAAQWRVWTAKDGVYDLRADLNILSSFKTIAYSIDSGKNWETSIQLTSGWKKFGNVTLRAGWNAIAIRLPQKIRMRALQMALSSKTAMPATMSLDLASSPQLQILRTDLVKDRNYRERTTLLDAYGNATTTEDFFDSKPQGLFADMVLVQKAGELVELRTATTGFDPTKGSLYLLIDNQRVNLSSIQRQGSGMLMQFPLDHLPASVRSSSLARPDLLNWTLVNSQTFTTTSYKRSCDFGYFNCRSTPQVATHTSNTPIALRWTGHEAWKSPFDSRRLPTPVVDVAYVGLDSLAFRVTGYEQTPSRRSVSGSLLATWSPGSQCLPTSTGGMAVHHVFGYSSTAGAMWSPRLHNTAFGSAGDPVPLLAQPTQDVANVAKTRPQWADFGAGGGFYPDLPLQSLGETPPMVSFLIRNPLNIIQTARLAHLPGIGNGEQRQYFQYRLVSHGIQDERAWKTGQGFRFQDQPAWLWASTQDPVLLVQPGLNRLEVRMSDAGASWDGFAIVPCDPQGVATLPTTQASDLTTEGQEAVREQIFGAGSLSPATGHSFEFQFQDRFGNTSEVTTVTQNTAAPSNVLPRVVTSLEGWDATSGWITGNTVGASFKPAASTSSEIELKARLLVRRGIDRRLETGLARDILVVPSSDGVSWTATIDLTGYALNEAEYSQGDRVVVEAWFEDGVSAGAHSAVEFGVRDQDQTTVIGGLFPAKIGSLTFTPRRAWTSTDGRDYADLLLSKLDLTDGDTARYQLMLRGASIDRSGTQLVSVSGGMATVEHCSRANSQAAWTCQPADRLPFSFGRWPGWIDALSVRLVGQGSQTRLQVDALEVLDDALRPVRNSDRVFWGDDGFLGSLELSRDRFWIRNVLAVGQEEAYGLEACRTTADRLATGTLKLNLRGCTEEAGPFLTFPLHLKTDGVWSLIGAGFDSIPEEYAVTWLGTSVHSPSWLSGRPSDVGQLELPASDVSITKSAIKEATGASLWGYTFKSYDFGRQGIKNLVLDLHLPDGQTTPYQNGVAQVVKTFRGGKVLLDANVMKGRPVLDGVFTSIDPAVLRIGSTLSLTGVTEWTFSQQASVGWTLKPTGALKLKGPQTDGWKVEKIDDLTAGMVDADAFYYPLSKLVLGPDLFVEVEGSHKVEFSTSMNDVGVWNSKGATLTTQITPVPGASTMELALSQTSLNLQNFFTSAGTSTAIPVTPTELDVRLDGEFRLADIEAFGATPSGSEVRVAGSPFALLVPSGRYQVLANRGQMLVRVSRPQGFLNLPLATSGAASSGSNLDPKGPQGTEVQSAVLTTTRLPVAVGAELPVPQTLQPYTLGDIFSLNLDRVYLDASMDWDNAEAKLALSAATTLTLGSIFDRLGLAGYRLPVRSATVSVDAKPLSTSPFKAADVTFELAEMNLALRAELTRGRLAKLANSSDNSTTGSSGDVLVRLATSGMPITGKYNGNALALTMKDWSLDLTEHFPLKGLANTSFWLNELSVNVNSDNFDIVKFEGSGSKFFSSLVLAENVALLGAVKTPSNPNAEERVEISVSNSGKVPKLALKAARVQIGNKIYTLGCGGTSSLAIALNGDIEGDFCFEVTDQIVLYPLVGSGEKKVWFEPTPATPMQVRIKFQNGVLTTEVANAPLKTAAIPLIAPTGFNATINKAILQASSSGLQVQKVEAEFDPKIAPQKIKEVFTLALKTVTLNYDALGTAPKIELKMVPELTLTNSPGCGVGKMNGNVQFSSSLGESKSFDLAWTLNLPTADCKIAELDIQVQNLKATGSGKDIDFVLDRIDVRVSSNLFRGNKNPSQAADERVSSDFVGSGYGIVATGLRVSYKGTNDDPFSISRPELKPVGFPSLKQPVEMEIPNTGIYVNAILNFRPLLEESKPGLAIENIGFSLPKSMGERSFNSNFGVLLNGEAPYVHPRGSLTRIPFEIPSLPIESFQFTNAKLVLAYVEVRPGVKDWVLDGTASLSLKGAVENIDALITFKKPDPGDCGSGICRAVLTVKLARASRIPLGTTGLYISGLKGGFYDGFYAPPCAKECTGQDLPKGMKVELQAFIEAESPEIAKGVTGVWVHLERIHFGVFGDFQFLSGRANGKACAALFGGGKQFHGDVSVYLDVILLVNGKFVIDIWEDRRGKNLAGEASASVGLARAAIIRSRWFKFPRSTRWFGPFVTRFGRFDNGSNGFTSGVRALGKTWGVGFVDGGFRLGNVGRFRLAKPTSGALANTNVEIIDGNEYRIYPLGLTLEGNELLSVNVASAEGTDWNGATIKLLKGDFHSEKDEFGGVSRSKFVASIADNDGGFVSKFDSVNLHGMVWRNPSPWNSANGPAPRYYVAIPKYAIPTNPEDASVSVESGADDLQVFTSLADPRLNLQAKPCDDNVDQVCITGTVTGFQSTVISRARSYTDEEKSFMAQVPGFDPVEETVLRQRHRLKLWTKMYRPAEPGVDTGSVPQEISLDQIQGGTGNEESLADLGCVTRSGNSLTVDCRWTPAGLPSGRYRLVAGAELEDHLDKQPGEPAEVVLLDSTRQILTNAVVDSRGFLVRNLGTPQAASRLAVTGSALSKDDHSFGDEKRRILVRFQPATHPDVVDHVVRWTDAVDGTHLFPAGGAGRWSFELFDPASKSSTPYGPDLIQGSMTGSNPEFDWAFSVPKSLEVIPVRQVWDDAKNAYGTDTLWAQGVKWNGNVQVGQSAGLTANPINLRRLRSGTLFVPQADSRLDTSYLDVSSLDEGNTSLRPSSDYFRTEMEWVDPTGQPLSEENRKFAPRVSLSGPEGLLGASVPQVVSFRPKSYAAVCQPSEVPDPTDPSKNQLVYSGTCPKGDTVDPVTKLGDYRLRLRSWNLGRLTTGMAVDQFIPVKVVPPYPRIDRLEPGYVLSSRNQVITLKVANLKSQSELVSGATMVRKSMLRLRDQSGNLIAAALRRYPAAAADAWLDELPLDEVQERADEVQVEVNLGTSNDVRMFIEVVNPWPTVLGANADSLTLRAFTEVERIPNPNQISCLGGDLNPVSQGYVHSMDFVGTYPKAPVMGRPLLVLMSELHSPQFTKWEVEFQQTGRPSVKVASKDVIATHDGLELIVPMGLSTSLPVTVKVTPLSGVGGDCTNGFTDTLKAPRAPRSKPLRTTTPSFQQRDGQWTLPDNPVVGLDLTALDKTERVEWMVGTPPEGAAWQWRAGLPKWSELTQPDSLRIRVRNRDVGDVDHWSWLIKTPPRVVTIQGPDGALARKTSLPLGTPLTWSAVPEAISAVVGTSVRRVDCRWNGGAWTKCPSEGWRHSVSQSGLLEIQVVWTVRGTSSDVDVAEPIQQWELGVKYPEGVQRIPLRQSGKRFGLWADTLDRLVVPVRLSGDALPEWGIKPPVVYNGEGEMVPQQTISYDPNQRSWAAWVELSELNRQKDQSLELWLNHSATPVSPWNDMERWAGTAAEAPVFQTKRTSGVLSFWVQWAGAPGTLVRAQDLQLDVDPKGALSLVWFGQTVQTKASVLPVNQPALVVLRMSGNGGGLEVNGIRQADWTWPRTDAAPWLPQEVVLGAPSAAITDLRWEGLRGEGYSAARFAAENRHPEFWASAPGTIASPVPREVRHGGGSVRPLESPVVLWADRDARVTQWPAAWSAASWLPGSAVAGASEQGIAGEVVLAGPARLCVVGPMDWTLGEVFQQSGVLTTDVGPRSVWCREAVAGVNRLVGPTNPAYEGDNGASWLILSSTQPSGSVGQELKVGDLLDDGFVLRTVLPGMSSRSSVPNDVGTARQGIEPGREAVLWLPVTPLPAGAQVLGSVDVVGPDGQKQVRLVVVGVTPSQAPVGSVWIRLEPSVVRPQVELPSLVETSQDGPVILPDGSQIDQWPWRPVLVTSSCSESLLRTKWRMPVRLWMALPPDAKTFALVDWMPSDRPVSVTTREGKTERWTLWWRDLPAGTFEWNASAAFPNTACTRLVWMAERLPAVAPEWRLESLRLRGVGGTAALRGGQHRITDLDVRFAATLPIKGDRTSLRVDGITVGVDNAVAVVLGLGDPKVGSRPDGRGGWETVVSSPSLPLQDLRPDRLDLEGLVANTQTLRAQGKVKLIVRQQGLARFEGGLSAVLFRDRDGDFRFTREIDQELGVQPVGKVDPGQEVVVEYALSAHDFQYPEELYLAWLNGGDVSPERERGSHVVAAGNPCLERKQFDWTVPELDSKGQEILVAALRDLDQNGRWTKTDRMDTLRYAAGQICYAASGDATLSWCTPDPWVGRAQDLAVRDVDGDGVPEILGGRQILSVDGTVRYDFQTAQNGLRLDLTEDGRLEELQVAGACRSWTIPGETALWSVGCSEPGLVEKLGRISRALEGCTDISLSGFLPEGQGMVVRVANAGTVDLPTDLPLVVLAGADVLHRVVLDRPLAAGEWTDVWVPVDPQERTIDVQVETGWLNSQGLLDLFPENQRRTWSPEETGP